MKKRTLFLLLTIAILASAFTACSKDETAETVKTETQPQAEEITEAETADPTDRTTIDDGLGQYNFGGREFRIATTDYNQNNMDVEEISGEIVKDSIYERNSRVEERFGCVINNIHVEGYEGLQKWMRTAIAADEDAFDLANQHVVLFGGTITEGNFMNLRNIEQIDFSRPWYSPSTSNELTFNGKTYMAIGDMDLSAIGRTWCVIYDKVQADAYNLPDLYEIVNKGEWTFDKSLELTGSIYEDFNGDGQQDNDDYYGNISNSGSAVNAYLWAFGEKVLSVENGEIVNTYYTEKLTNIVQKLTDAFHGGGIHSDYNYVSPNGHPQYYGWEMYQKEKALMINGRIEYTLDYFRELENDYGVIPYPKYDLEQDQYYSMVDGGHCVMAVPVTVSDTEFVGVIFEALNADSYKYVVPEYYDTALRFKGLRDQQSFDMMDMITNSRVFDMGYVHDNWKGASFIIEKLVTNNDPNIASYWAANKKAIEMYYDTIIEFYTDGEDVSEDETTVTEEVVEAEVPEVEIFTISVSSADEFLTFFNELHSGKYTGMDMLVTLEADIDLGNQVLKTDPAGVFNGDFDGKGHTISNFILEASNGRGLLGCSQQKNDRFQKITNLVVEGADVRGLEGNDRQSVLFGGVLGALYFENVYVSGTLDCVNGGAFVGKLMNTGSATFKNCVSAVTLKDQPSSAGFVGCTDPAVEEGLVDPANPDTHLTARVRMEDCAFYGTISSENNAAFVGTVNGEVEFKNCISAPVSGENRLCVNVDNTTVNSTNVIENAADLASLNWDGWTVSGEYLLPASVAELLAD